MTSIEAYNILLKRQINEDRILAERTSMFLLATAFLFVAFVTLLDPCWAGTIFKVLRILLPSVGIFLTLLLLLFNVSAVKALGFWHEAQGKIEKAAGAEVFKYMKEKGIAPHIRTPRNWFRRTLLRTRAIYWLYLPLTFFVLWTTSLVLVTTCYPYLWCHLSPT